MKRRVNVFSSIVSLWFIIFGFMMFGEADDLSVEYAIRGAGFMAAGGFLILSGSLGLLLQLYLYNTKK